MSEVVQQSETKNRVPTKSTITKKQMKDFLTKGLSDKTVKKKEYNDFMKKVKQIVSQDIDNKEQLKKTREAFWEMFGSRVSPSKSKAKANPLYNMFADIAKEVVEAKVEE